MKVKELSEDLCVCAQIKVSDVAQVAKLGFKSIVCNRPDGEGLWQPRFSDITKAAGDAGLMVAHLPVSPGAFGPNEASAFGEILESLPKPVLAYCASGNRSLGLWSLLQAKEE